MDTDILELLVCLRCGTVRVAGFVCRACGGRETDTAAASGDATLEAVTVVRVPPVEGAEIGPYAVAVARLREPAALLSGRLMADPDAAAALPLDTPMQVVGNARTGFTILPAGKLP